MLFLETGSPAKSLSTKTVILSRCFSLRNLSAASGRSHQIPRCTFQRDILEVRSFSGPHVSLFQPVPICLGPSTKVSYKHICILLRQSSSESDSVFRLTPVCPAVFSRGVLTALVFVFVASCFSDDEWSVSQVRSKYCPI